MSLNSWQETLIAAQVNGTARSAAAAASLLPAQALWTFPTNYFGFVGKQIRITASGILSTAATTPGTWRFDVRFGATVVFDTTAGAFNAATNAYTNVNWWFDLLLTITTAGAAATFMPGGFFTAPNLKGGTDTAMPIGGLAVCLPYNTAAVNGTAFDATQTQQMDFFWTQTVATGSITLKNYSVSALN